ncbi:hypothetical protein KCP70_09335 [Salmonella enterica subsp. enterica]|nr:hypothetical protein KCP70_09335 [Salmonella enterica subsp. enterica]
MSEQTWHYPGVTCVSAIEVLHALRETMFTTAIPSVTDEPGVKERLSQRVSPANGRTGPAAFTLRIPFVHRTGAVKNSLPHK